MKCAVPKCFAFHTIRNFAALLLLAAMTILPASPARAVSGTLNSYAAVTGISGSNLTVSTTSGFNVGDTVLIVQMQGALVNVSNDASHGTVSGYSTSGVFEYGKVSSVGAGTIGLSATVSGAYDITGSVQIVRVATYTDVTIDGNVTAPLWNGTTGGVVAIDASGTLTLTSNINVNARGLRGGALPSNDVFSCAAGSTQYTGTGGNSIGNKGESIAANSSSFYAAYRGKKANGGGGGNPQDAGGGGGSNYGSGGNGGREDMRCNRAYGGQGGVALDYSGNNRLFSGGGGGSGSQVGESVTSTGLGAGGGIVILRVGILAGNGGAIRAAGGGGGYSQDNGASGGGGGGSVAIRATSVTGTVNVNVTGGAGGDQLSSATGAGPGGGGGGGVVALVGISCGQVSWTATGGTPGISLYGLNNGDASWGALGGTSGTCLSGFSIPAMPTSPSFTVTKTSALFASGSTGLFMIPGNYVEYTITISNTGTGTADTGSMLVVDALPAELTFFNGNHDGSGNPLAVTNGSGASCCTAAQVKFRNASGVDLSPQPAYGGTGLDTTIRQLAITPSGALAAGASLILKFRLLIR